MLSAMERLRVLWGVMLATSLTYPVLLVAVGGRGDGAAASLLPVLTAVAVGLGVASRLAPSRVLRRQLSALHLTVVDEQDPAAGPTLFRDPAPTRRVFAEPARARAWAGCDRFGPAPTMEMAVNKLTRLAGVLAFGSALCLFQAPAHAQFGFSGSEGGEDMMTTMAPMLNMMKKQKIGRAHV